MQKYIFVFILVFTFSAFSSTFVPIPFKKQIKESDAIIYGQVVNTSSVSIGAGVATKVFIRLDKWIGAEVSNNHIEVFYPGGEIGNKATTVAGTPKFRVGERVALFLGKDKEGKYWGKNLGLGKYSEQKFGNGKVLINEMFPKHPEIGQKPLKYFLNIVQKVKSQKFITREKDKYEIQQMKHHSRMGLKSSVKKVYGRSIASVTPMKKNESSSEISIFWLLVILGLMGGLSSFRNKRKS